MAGTQAHLSVPSLGRSRRRPRPCKKGELVFDLIASLLSFFFDLSNNYAVAIILLTLVVLVVSTPLTLTGTRSMLKMQLLQPQLKEIQNKYDKDQREEMNAEMMEFYKENNINPVGGCLPMLFQIPVFLVLYRVILGITRRATDVGSGAGAAIGSLTAGTTPQQVDLGELQPFNPAYINEDTQMFRDLTGTTESGLPVTTMDAFGFDLARSASQVLGDGIVGAIPYLALILVVFGTGYFQHKMIRARQTGAAVNPTQEMIMKFMPYFLPIFAFTLPAAIVFYFLVSNMYRIAQQYYITRSMYSGDDSLGAQIRQQREANPQDGAGNKKQDAKKNGSGGKGSAKKTAAKKNQSTRQGGAGKNGGKSGRHKTATKTATATATRTKNSTSKNSTKSSATQTRSPGRNSSGRQASARDTVQPKARKKKKR